MQSYRWLRQGWSGKEWLLLQGDRVAAHLRYSPWGRTAELDLDGRRWSLRTSGFWTTRIHLAAPDGHEVAVARLRSRGADIEGRLGTAAWVSTSWWRSSYELRRAGQGAAARMHVRGATAHVEADLAQPDLVPLLGLGLVAHLLMQAAAAASTVAVTTAVTAATPP